jgi:hypothetical protein
MTAADRKDEGRWSFGDWVDLLGGHFFTPERTGTPVTFFVDDEILAKLSGMSPEAAAESLVGAICDLFGDLRHARPYELIAKATGAWERSGSEGYIRCLPLLALAVLAGTRMAADHKIHKNNYYKRYRALIGLTGGGQPPGYELVPRLWAGYSRWLDETREGTLGLSTVREHPFYVYIGQALSQALFRASDRHELTYFLDSLGAPVTDSINRDRLVALLRTWAEWRGRFSAGARLLIKDPAYAEQLELLIRDAANRWDGTVLNELGRRESRILLHWNYEDGEPLTTLAERVEGFPDPLTIGSGTDRRVLEGLPGTRFYRQAPADVTADLLENGRRIPGAYSFRLVGSGIHLLAENGEVPGWSSTRRFAWNRPHILIADGATAAALKPLLERGAEPGYNGPRANASFPTGWMAYRLVIPTARATECWSGSPLGQLLPIDAPKPTLANGLRLARGRVYLRGGEPDLICPEETYELDGERKVAVPGSVVSLRGRGLRAGRHIVSVGANRLRFALAHGSASLPAQVEFVTLTITPDAILSGAAAPDEWARERWIWPVMRKKQYLAVGPRPGQLAKLEHLPQVQRTAKIIWSALGEVEVPFEPVWMVVRDHRRGQSVRLISAREPETHTRPSGLQERAWARVFLTPAPGAPDLWQRYKQVAEEMLGTDGAG